MPLIKIDTEHPLLEELAKYYAAQKIVAELPQEIRVVAEIGAIRDCARNENIEENAVFLSVITPTLR